jgi:hypothetical protein
VNHGNQVEQRINGVKTTYPRLWAVRDVETVMRMSQTQLFERYRKELELRVRKLLY